MNVAGVSINNDVGISKGESLGQTRTKHEEQLGLCKTNIHENELGMKYRS